jgi:adenosylhomocysteinase
MSYAVKNTEVYESGQQKIRWVANKMPILNKIAEIYRDQKPFSGYRIAMSIHLEAKTAYLALKLKELGATVYLTGCNPLSTQDDVAAALVKEGINVFAWYDCTEEEYVNNLIKVLECKPHLIIDDGGDLVHLLHTVCPEFAENLIGGERSSSATTFRGSISIVNETFSLSTAMVTLRSSPGRLSIVKLLAVSGMGLTTLPFS